jgi:hypothetical protein
VRRSCVLLRPRAVLTDGPAIVGSLLYRPGLNAHFFRVPHIGQCEPRRCVAERADAARASGDRVRALRDRARGVAVVLDGPGERAARAGRAQGRGRRGPRSCVSVPIVRDAVSTSTYGYDVFSILGWDVVIPIIFPVSNINLYLCAQ